MKTRIISICLILFSITIFSQSKYELMERILAKKQADYDKAVTLCYEITRFQINHLEGEYDTANAKDLKRFYRESANAILQGLHKYPGESAAFMILIRNLITKWEGDENRLAIEASYYARQRFFKDFEGLRNTNPEKFIQMLKDADDKWGGNSLAKVWSAY